MNDIFILPDGSQLLLRMPYTIKEVHGVTVLAVVSFFSLIAVVGLLCAISLSAFNTRSSLDRHLFVRTHAAAYFVSLLLCDSIQALGSIFNVKWVRAMEVEVGNFCVLQGVFKQAADVGVAFWTLVIASHTFCLLFLQVRQGRFVLLATLIVGWLGIATIVIGGPATLDTKKRGPFYGISGFWCWISQEYPVERVTLDYMIMFMAALFSFVLYTLIFLRLRGNIVLIGRHVSFRKVTGPSAAGWRRQQSNDEAMAIARKMLLYPIAYTIIILPIAVARFTAWSGHDVPFEATIFCDVVFLFSGMVNVTLFMTMREFLPPESMAIHMSIPKWSIGKPAALPSPTESGPDPYYGSSAYDREDEEKGSVSSQTVVALPRDTTVTGAPSKTLAPAVQSGHVPHIPRNPFPFPRKRPAELSISNTESSTDSVYNLHHLDVQSNRRWSPQSRGSPETYASSPPRDAELWHR